MPARRRFDPALTVAFALLVALPACKSDAPEDDSSGGGWAIPDADQGPAFASNTDHGWTNGPDAWFAAAQVTPVLDWDQPATQIPLYLWEIAQGDNIADLGSCPYLLVEGATETWKSDCRSRDGYEWTGQMSETRWDDDNGWQWIQWDMDLEIIGDVEGAVFERLRLEGQLLFALGDGDDFVRGSIVNAQAGVDGYWEQHSISDQREEAWADWALTGRHELYTDGVHRIDGTAELGSLGGFRYTSDALTEQPDCAGEPAGVLELSSEQTAQLSFEGTDSCDRCAAYALDGEYAGQACGD